MEQRHVDAGAEAGVACAFATAKAAWKLATKGLFPSASSSLDYQ